MVSSHRLAPGSDGTSVAACGQSATWRAMAFRPSTPQPIGTSAKRSRPNGISSMASRPHGMIQKPVSGTPSRLATTPSSDSRLKW